MSELQVWDFTVDTLRRHSKLQGFTASDRTVQWLFECMAAFTPVQQKQFVRFVTGCPRLPTGGIKNLNPCTTDLLFDLMILFSFVQVLVLSH